MILRNNNLFKVRSIKGDEMILSFEEIRESVSIVQVFFDIELNGIKYDETEIENVLNDGINFSDLDDRQLKLLFKLLKKKLPYYNPYRVFWKWINRDCILTLEFIEKFIKLFNDQLYKECFWKYFNEYQLDKMVLSTSFLEKYIDFLDLNKLKSSLNEKYIPEKLRYNIEKNNSQI